MPQRKTVNRLSTGRRFVLYPAALLARAWIRTFRLSKAPGTDENFRQLSSEGALFVLWHNHLLIAPELHRRLRPGTEMHGLISASRDGAWLSGFFGLLGIRSIRGSEGHRGMESTREIIRVIRQGGDVGITPDGSKGPAHQAKAGVISVARTTGAPILAVGATFHSAWRLNTWDRFFIPKPFSRVSIRTQLIRSHLEIGGGSREEQAKALSTILNKLTEPENPQ